MKEAERFARDLTWAVNSPSLMDLTGQATAAASPLETTDFDHEHLSEYLSKQRGGRVGRYFEQLISYWIRHVRRCEILAQSHQLRDGNRTIGEIDLLFRDEQGRVTHWEVACKFYLRFDAGDPPKADYIGPNARDTLTAKATRLIEHQLPVAVRHFPDIEVGEAFVKGRIFYHWQTGQQTETGPSESSPAELAPDHLSGCWVHARELPDFLRANRLRYRVLRKPFWLAEERADPSDDDVLTTTATDQLLQEHFHSRQTPVLLSGFPDGASPVSESERCFVVSDQWPLPSDAAK